MLLRRRARDRPVVLVEQVGHRDRRCAQRVFEQLGDLPGGFGRGGDERRVFGLDAALGDELDQMLGHLEERFAAAHRGVERATGLVNLGLDGTHLLVQRAADRMALLGRGGDARHTGLHVGQRAVKAALLVLAFLHTDLARQGFDARIELADRAHDFLR